MPNKIIENNLAKLIFIAGTCITYFFSIDNSDLSFIGNPIYLILTAVVAFYIDSDFREIKDFSFIEKLIFSIIIFITYFAITYYLADIVGAIFGIIGLSLMR